MISSLPSSEFECHVVVPDEPPLRDALEEAGARVHVVPMRRVTTSASLGYRLAYAAHWPVTVLRLARLVRRLKIDVVHTNSIHSWYGWAVAALTRKPHVWSAREIVVQSNAALHLERFLARHFATTVVAISHAVHRRLGAPDAWIFAEAPNIRRADRGRLRTKLGIDPGTFVFGAAGRIDTWKGFDVLLDAWERASLDGALVIAGGAVAGKEAFARDIETRARGLRGVYFLGALSDVSELYADIDALVMPSTFPEPLGLVMLEALMSGVPVIATDHGGPPEILTGHEERGILVPPNDADALARAMRSATGTLRRSDDPLWDAPPSLWPKILLDVASR
jgi:glycosyltransferase involved in cell wall biosynthesis